MDDFLASQSDARSWAARMAHAARAHEARTIALLIKPAAMVAAVAGRIDLVERWLRYLPPELIERDGQLLYWAGTSTLLKRPAEAQPRLQRAFELLSSGDDPQWAVLAWAGLVDSIFLHYRDLSELDPLFEWMTVEREQTVDAMPLPPRRLVVGSVLFAMGFRQPRHQRMAAWRERGERLFELDPASELGARLAAGLLTDYTWRGNLAAAEIVWSRFHARATRSRLSPLTAVIAHVNEATLLLHKGSLGACLRAVESGLEASKRHNIRVWEGVLRCHAVAASCSRLDLGEARRHLAAIEALFADGVPVDEAYYRCMLFWSAFVAGDHVGAASRCSVAIELTDRKGVPYFQGVCRVGAALALFEAGHSDDAGRLLDEGAAIGRDIGNPVLEWMSGLIQAHIFYSRADRAAGDAALTAAMRLGRDHSLVHFFLWPRAIIARLIDRAMQRGYAPDYASFLVRVHELGPGREPTWSDRWQFSARIYTFGEPRVEYADGRVEVLSLQFLRQLELLSALIAKEGRPVPLRTVAAEIYPMADVDAFGSAKRVLHSLRSRFGMIVTQHNALLALDFNKVWIDACAFQHLRRSSGDAVELERWLDAHYKGPFMAQVEGSGLVQRVRLRLQEQVGRVLRDARTRYLAIGDEDGVSRFDARWESTVFGGTRD